MSAAPVLPDPTPPNTGGDGLEEMFLAAIAKRDAKRIESWKAELAKLAEPDRTTVTAITETERATPATREHPPIVSRWQPTDRIYERIYRDTPAVRKFRTADLDHWYQHWFRGAVNRDRVAVLVAQNKIEQILGRATTLEGALDASDPTAILSGTGGHLLPQGLSDVVQIARDLEAVLPSLVAIKEMTGPTLRIPTQGAVTAAMAAEGATASQGESTYATELLKAQKMSATMKVSVEMLADSPSNFVSDVAQRAGAAMGALEDVQICTTNGTAPNISEAIAGGNVNEATSTVLIYEDLVTLIFALTKPYRRNAVFLGGTVVCTLLSKLMDGNDRPILSFPTQQPNVITDTPGAIGSIFGKPVFEVPLAAGTLIFGDVRQGYAMGRRSGITMATSEHFEFTSDLINIKFTQRFDGRIVDDVAMKQMAGLATVA